MFLSEILIKLSDYVRGSFGENIFAEIVTPRPPPSQLQYLAKRGEILALWAKFCRYAWKII